MQLTPRSGDEVTESLHIFPKHSYEELRKAILRAEVEGELSELQALGLQAILAFVEGDELAGDYLEMAEAAVAEHRAAQELQCGERGSKAPWDDLHSALQDLVSLDGECIACLIELLLLESNVGNICPRSTLKELLERCNSRGEERYVRARGVPAGKRARARRAARGS